MKEKGQTLSRREFLTKTGFASVALLTVGTLGSVIPVRKESLASWIAPRDAAAMALKDVNEELKATFGNRKIELSHVTMKAPIIAENGGVVPINISSDLPMKPGNYVKKIYVYVDKNYDPYVGSVDLTPANGKAAFSLRIKMRKTSQVRAILETSQGKLYAAVKTVKVTIGGCGG
ncbi:MAG: thiosulfate oxidation carrier protein SoxY [Deltaproteobacteria bacterium]|nr:thiosulfate oxidation carrier protein SoxY [Deltaproteobacteria bacterium]